MYWLYMYSRLYSSLDLLFLKLFLMLNLMHHLVLYLKFRISIGLERLINYAGEFQRKGSSLIFRR